MDDPPDCGAGALGARSARGAVSRLEPAAKGLANAVLRPLLIFFTLPLVLLTLGLFILVINALLLMLAAWAVPGFHLDGFLTAFLASLLISIVSFFLNRMVGGGGRGQRPAA